MTLEELQTMVMRQAVARLEHLEALLAEAEAADPKSRNTWKREEVEDQKLLIAKLMYQHEREATELEQAIRDRGLARALDRARLAELEHLTAHRDAILAAFEKSTEVQREGFEAVAKAIRERAG